jgi:ankyrin repeat protein
LQADSKNREGNTPLHYACQYCPVGKTLTIVKLLQWSEKSILLPNKAGETPYALAIRFNKKGQFSGACLEVVHACSRS